MDRTAHRSYKAEDRSYFSILKKEIHQLAVDAGFSTTKTGKIDIIVAEMASNLVKHAGGGEILVQISPDNDNPFIELISIDNGPGMADPAKMTEDGFSTSNTLGHGLGSIKRLSDNFQIYSQKDWGTVLLSRVYKGELPHFTKKSATEIKSIVVAKPGETESGDGTYYTIEQDRVKIFLGDGLGHGADAHTAIQAAVNAFKQSDGEMPAEILRSMHVAVKKTRGLVGTVAIYYFKERKWRICGIGNIATRILHSLNIRNCMPYNGIIGMNVPNTIKEQEIINERGQILVMCSDGIKTRWDIQKYNSIFKYDLTIAAAAIYKDFARKTDDMSVLVARIN